MNKARRHELKMLKYKRRLHNLNLKEDEGKFFSYRSHGAPCSCFICSHSKYKRAKEKSKLPQLIDFELNYDAGEMEYNHEKGIFIYSEN